VFTVPGTNNITAVARSAKAVGVSTVLTTAAAVDSATHLGQSRDSAGLPDGQTMLDIEDTDLRGEDEPLHV